MSTNTNNIDQETPCLWFKSKDGKHYIIIRKTDGSLFPNIRITNNEPTNPWSKFLQDDINWDFKREYDCNYEH